MNTKALYSSYIVALFLFALAGMLFFSCTKSTPSPTPSPAPAAVSTFTANVNGSAPITFTPSKTTSGGSTSLIGKSTYYTITLVFPSTTGPGNFTMGQNGFTASIYDGANTYYVNSSETASTGTFEIDSIPGGKYYGHFNFIAEDAAGNNEDAGGQYKNM